MGDAVHIGDHEFDTPEPYQSIVAQRMAHDESYFEEHPDRQQFVRPMVDGEFWPAVFIGMAHVEVTRIAPGIRARRPITRGAR